MISPPGFEQWPWTESTHAGSTLAGSLCGPRIIMPPILSGLSIPAVALPGSELVQDMTHRLRRPSVIDAEARVARYGLWGCPESSFGNVDASADSSLAVTSRYVMQSDTDPCVAALERCMAAQCLTCGAPPCIR